MPGSVTAAAPATVLPFSLSSSFQEARAFACRISGPYPDGRSQRASRVTTERRTWDLVKSLTYAQWYALYLFFLARRGATEPFYLYVQQSAYDATGVSTTGRYTVRFRGSLSRTYQMGRQQASLSMIEIA